jgi:hypothetical protein
MVEMRIDISELKAEGDELIKELVNFLHERTGLEVERVADEIVMEADERGVPKQYLRVLLRKFLHRAGLKDYFRVIGGKENTLIVKERKMLEEE